MAEGLTAEHVVEWFGEKVQEEIESRLVKQMLIRAVQLYERILQELFRTPKSGRIYKRGGKLHQASAPGEAPAVDSGRLSQSVTHEIARGEGATWEATVGTNVIYGPALEFGRRDGTIAPRPAWVPAMVELQKHADEFMVKEE